MVIDLNPDLEISGRELTEADVIALSQRDFLRRLTLLHDDLEEILYLNKYHKHELRRERLERFSEELSELIRTYS